MAESELPTIPPPEPSGIARAAAIVALGNVSGRVLGLARETVKSDLFGAGWRVDAFQVASVVPTQLYELLVGGMVTGGLVPVFSDYADQDNRGELERLLFTLLVLLGAALAALVVAAELAAPLIAGLLGRGFEAEKQQLTVTLLRITLPAVFFLSMSGVLTGLLYALKRFSLPSFTSSVFNAGIVVAALLLRTRLGVASMAAGILIGSILQIALQLPGLRDVRLRWQIDLQHPGLRRLARLYGPVAVSLIISQAAIYLSVALASLAGEGSLAWMSYATTLIQFPLGLVSTAISVAILPTLSRQAGGNNGTAEFLATLAQGLRMVLFLIIPATVGLFALGRPIIALLFEHGEFTRADTLMTTHVLYYYLVGLTFAAIDLPLIYAFYARKDTLTPAVVGLVCILIYLGAALFPTLFHPLHVTDLALANSIQWLSHALIMLILLTRRVGRLHGGVWRLTIQSIACSVLMGAAAWAAVQGLEAALPNAGQMGEALLVGGGGAAGLLTYLGLMRLLKVQELDVLRLLVRWGARG